MNNYAYMTLITKEFYLPCIIRQAQRIKHLKSKYPYIVMVTDNMNYNIIRTLEANNIEYRIIPYMTLTGPDVCIPMADTICKLYILTFSEFDKILFIDGDIIFVNNMDHLFDEMQVTNEVPIGVTNTLGNTSHANGCCLFCKPNINYFNYLKQKLAVEQYRDDEYFYDQLMAENKMINLSGEYINGICHFSSPVKMWMLTYEPNIQCLFYLASEEKFNKFFDKYGETIADMAMTMGNVVPTVLAIGDKRQRLTDESWTWFFNEEREQLK